MGSSGPSGGIRPRRGARTRCPTPPSPDAAHGGARRRRRTPWRPSSSAASAASVGPRRGHHQKEVLTSRTVGLLRSGADRYGQDRPRLPVALLPLPPRASSALDRPPTQVGLETRDRWSGRRGSNPRHSAWEADTLPTELRPLAIGGRSPPNRANRIAPGRIQASRRGLAHRALTSLPASPARLARPCAAPAARSRRAPFGSALPCTPDPAAPA